VRYLFEDYELDTDRQELRRGADPVTLEPQVFDVLTHLIRHRDRVVSRDDLLSAVWNGRIVSDSALTTRINAARHAIGDSGEAQRFIKTLIGKGYRFVGTVQEEQRPASAAAAATSVDSARPGPPLPDKPSIAVLPFANLSGDQEQDYFADGVVDDIITELARFSELFVIARNSSFQYKGKAPDIRQVGRELGVRYVLEGSIRRSGSRVRIAAQLIDAATAAHCWAERYDRELDDIFALQGEVARTIAAILAAQINWSEAAAAASKPPTNWQAHDYYLRAGQTYVSFLTTHRADELYETRQLLDKCLAADPRSARAHALLSNTFIVAYVQPVDRDYINPAALDRAYQLALAAAQLDPNLPVAHAKLGNTLTFKGRPEEAIAAFERALALNPNFTDWRFAFPLLFSGQFTRAIEVADRHMRLDPFYPPHVLHMSGLAHYMLGQYSDAESRERACVARSPKHRAAHAVLAATCARLGRLEEARATAAEVLRVEPNYTINGQRRLMLFKSPQHAEHYFGGLRKAGLPEL
jgi:adenylate cyclase